MTAVPVVSLREVTDDNRLAVEGLAVAPSQTQYVESVAISLDEAVAFPKAKAWYRAIYADDTPVGFVMISDGVEAEDLTGGELLGPYFLWRLLIDEHHQRHGYATAAMAQVIDYVRDRPGAERLLTSCVPGQQSPVPFYEKLGFRRTGDVHEGEVVLELRL